MGSLSSCFRCRAVFIALGSVVFSASLVWAGGGSGTALGALSPNPAGLTVGTGASHAFSANLKGDDPGNLSRQNYPLRASYRFEGGPGGFLVLNSVYEYSDYDWSEAGLFEATNTVAFSAIGLRRFGESDWGVFGFGQMGWSAETGASLNRGFSSTAIVGPAYSFSRNLSLVVGGLVSIQPERSTRAFPVAGLNWRIDDKWSVRTLNGVIVTYFPDEERRFQMDVSAEYRSRGIRLRRQVLPGGAEGTPAVDEREIAAGFGLGWRLREGVVVQGVAEYLFAREWNFREDNNRFRTVKANAAPQLGFRVDYSF